MTIECTTLTNTPTFIPKPTEAVTKSNSSHNKYVIISHTHTHTHVTAEYTLAESIATVKQYDTVLHLK